MFSSIQLTRNADPDFRESVNELFQSTSRLILYTLAGIYLCCILATVIWPDQIAMTTWLIVPAALAVLLLAYWLLPRVYLLAHIVLHLGLAGSITLAVYLFQVPEIAFFYAMLPMLAVVCLGWRTASAMELIVIGLVYWLNHGLLVTPPGPALSFTILLAGVVSGVLGWASMQSVLTVTEWSLYSLKQARQNLEDARDHRAQLAHVVKELDSANIRLDRLNQMLVLARAEAEEAREARNRFALAISHELRTPLNFIISFSEIMVKTPDTYAPLNRWPAGLFEDIQEIYRSSQHLMRLVNDVLDLGQIENLRMSLVKEWISLAQIVSEVTAMVQRAFDLKNIALKTVVEPDLPIVFVDRTRIRQVLLNLVNNSLRFTDQGSVTIHLRRHVNNTLLICVEDTGIGIEQEDLNLIFQEFQQVSRDSWRRREGTGLGVPISKRFIELHGGQMWVESEVGQGTRFYFTLPVAAGGDKTSLAYKDRDEQYWQALKEKAEKGKNILVLSPDPSAADVLAPYVEGFSLVGAAKLEEIQAQAAALLPHAIFADQRIAEEPEVQEQLNRLPYDLPVLYFHFPGNPAHPPDLPDCVRYYLVKPIPNQLLVEAVLSLGESARRLLVVDDDPAMAGLVTRALRSRFKGQADRRYQVETALTGQAGLDCIRENPPDVILLDVELPDISGLNLLAEAEQRDIPVIFITAHEWPKVFPERDYEVLRVQMRRPLSRSELTQVIKNLLETIRPKYPVDLGALVHPAAQTG